MNAENGDGEADKLQIAALAGRLKLAVDNSGGAAIIAERSGVALRTLHTYLAAGPDPKLFKLLRIADACGVSLAHLVGRKENSDNKPYQDQPFGFPPRSDYPLSAGRRAAKAQRLAKSLPEVSFLRTKDNIISHPGEIEGFVPVPRLSIDASAGSGRFADNSDTAPAVMMLRESWLRELGVSPSSAQILSAKGDSMEPTIRDGDLLLIDRAIDGILDNGIYVVVLAGLVMVKRVQTRFDRSLVLISDNPSIPPDPISPDRAHELIVEGRVRWVGRLI